jgi:hypothetical protein
MIRQIQVIRIPTYETMPKDFEVLTPRQRAFVIAMFTLPDPSIVDCVRVAGYKDSGGGDPAPHAQGQKLMQNPNVRAALQAEMFRRAEAAGPKALRYVQAMAFTKGHRDQYKVLKTVLTFAGMREINESRQEVTVKSDAEQLLELKQIAARLGLQVHELIGNMTEAEWEVVTAADSSAGESRKDDGATMSDSKDGHPHRTGRFPMRWGGTFPSGRHQPGLLTDLDSPSGVWEALGEQKRNFADGC